MLLKILVKIDLADKERVFEMKGVCSVVLLDIDITPEPSLTEKLVYITLVAKVI